MIHIVRIHSVDQSSVCRLHASIRSVGILSEGESLPHLRPHNENPVIETRLVRELTAKC
jgi:hypothetical protein